MTDGPPSLPPRRRSCLGPALIVLLILVLLGIGLWWWYNRPIEPVTLTPQERATVEQKVEAIQDPEPQYEPGVKEIVLTERELNGLLNENTTLGETLHFELATGAIHARIETDLDPEVPVVGGRRLKARARFFVNDVAGRPSLVLDDLTVWGISLPNDWLAGMKGQDLLEDLLGNPAGGGMAGVESLKIEPGRMLIRLAE